MIDLERYFEEFTCLVSEPKAVELLGKVGDILADQKESEGRLLLFGNGAASSIAGHAALDFTKQGGLRSLCFHDPALITAYANDFGYDNSVAEIISSYYEPTDIVIFLSVSGESPNILRGLDRSRELGLRTIGFSGRSEENGVNKAADFAFWVDSQAYNIVENVHSSWLLSLCDYLIGRAVYEVS